MIPFPDIDPKILTLGQGVAISWYSLSYVIGIGIGWFYAIQIVARMNLGISREQIDDFVTYAIVGIIIGGRLGYVVFYDLEYHILHPIEILKTYNGGMSFHGAVVGVAVATFLFMRSRKLNFWSLFDLVCVVSPFGIFLGRIANFINMELYGRPADVPWGVLFPGVEHPRHPSQIYEALTEGLILLIIMYIYGIRRKQILIPGKTSCVCIIIYGVFRIFNEFFREPDYQIGYILNYFTLGQILSIPYPGNR